MEEVVNNDAAGVVVSSLGKTYCDLDGSEMFQGYLPDEDGLQWICPECGFCFPV